MTSIDCWRGLCRKISGVCGCVIAAVLHHHSTMCVRRDDIIDLQTLEVDECCAICAIALERDDDGLSESWPLS